MPKMKTHKGFKKRIKVTGTGKILHAREGMGHLLSGKSRRRKRRLKHEVAFAGANRKNVRRSLGI